MWRRVKVAVCYADDEPIPSMIQMVGIGEEAGVQRKCSIKSTYYENEVDNAVDGLTTDGTVDYGSFGRFGRGLGDCHVPTYFPDGLSRRVIVILKTIYFARYDDAILATVARYSVALTVFGLLGLCVGSFLNVVIHRTPLIMMKEWRAGIVEILGLQEDIPANLKQPIADIIAKDTPTSLSRPPSRCPHCGHFIKWYENFPLVSWLALRGKCSSCHTPISIRYPLVELATALLSVLVIWEFGVTAQGLAGLALVWTLIALLALILTPNCCPIVWFIRLAVLAWQ